jgi:3-hydroxyisobutyrate dehydrogenase-like beta-hydroxyacid dehydrogenase
MGRGMASNLCRKGFELVVYEITPEPMLALEKLGVRPGSGGLFGE